ncbi:M20 metallopeptidase family protein [Bacillus thermotolerans]|uniref:Hydrolase n=1 Tax=Bacillus thermotolerans TaxID=1221996 RepID=A0A0F5HPD6_BACTR|nr:amidohydrolase [Bacillus thermotolerans]KKB34915.1 putative hydrolase [Bacillus thermotolerans]KKB39996.1 putative hydrolase [Bacillus thermotolerans]KKB43106.1 putative hydrolase [Bacillus thermotolerans]
MDTKNLELAKQLRHELHRHPELSNQETWTKQRLIDFLEEHTRLEIVDKGPWFYAVYRAGENKQNIAFRADFDALPMEETLDIPHASQFPGISHKCGHDGHSASLAGFALEIDQKGADKNIFFLFQHAEETGDGAAQCVSFIKENDIEEIFAYHNMSGMMFKSINVIDGTAHYASKGMTIHMEGAPAHASQPEDGANPAFAMAKIIDAIPEFTSPENNKGVVLCTVVQVDIGERAFGVSASKGDLLLTIRAFYAEELDKLQKNLENLANEQAGKYGLRVSFSYDDSFPETVNHKESSDRIRQAAKKKGLQLVEMKEAFRGSEDFGHYLKETKGAMCYIGNGENYPHIHTYEYDFQDELIETAVELFKELAEQ